jgi:hypothetical protein
LSGSFGITLNDGNEKRTFKLIITDKGLFIPSWLWKELNNFLSGYICLVLATHVCDEKDYFRDYDNFYNHKK